MLPRRAIDLSDRIAPALVAPLPVAPGVCHVCRSAMGTSYTTCFPCGHQPQLFDAVVPISYAVAESVWHRLLGGYKDTPDLRHRTAGQAVITAVL